MEKNKKFVKRSVIARKNLPTNLPITNTVLFVLMYKVFPPDGYWGILYSLWLAALVLLWLASIINVIAENQVDIFERFGVIAKKMIMDDMGKIWSKSVKKNEQ